MNFRPAAFLFLPLASVLGGDAEGVSLGVEVDRGEIIDQHFFRDSRNACGPAAMANSLRFGNAKAQGVWFGFLGTDPEEKLRFAIDRWFRGRQSVVFPELKRLRPNGIEGEDLAAAYGEVLGDHRLRPVKGWYLDRREDEPDAAFVARLHRSLSESLEHGIPPILGMRSFLAKRDESENEPTSGEIVWRPSRSHYVTVTRLPKLLPENELGFSLEIIDPNGGRVTTAFVYAETSQPFIALKGNERTGRWLRGSPFLVVQAPRVTSLQPEDAVWKDRIIIVAHYLVGASFAWR